jgi:hypothetical protein
MNMKWELVEMLKAFEYAKSRDITNDDFSVSNTPENVGYYFKIVRFSDKTVILVSETNFYIGTPIIKETREYYVTQIPTSSGWSDDGEFDTLEVAKCYKTPDGRIMKIHVTSEEVE